MKLVYLSESRIPSREANAVHVMKMCSAIASLGHEVVLVAPKTSDIEPDIADPYAFYGVPKTFEMRRLPRSSVRGLNWIYGWNAGRVAAGEDFDAAFGRSLYACAVAAKFGMPTAWDAHMATFLGRWRERIAFDAMIKAPTFLGVTTNCQALTDAVLDQVPALSGRIVTAHNGADPIPDGLAPVELAQNRGGLKVGYIGQLYPGKGLEIIRELARMTPWATFHIVGGNRDALASLAAEGSLASNIRVHGFVPPHDVERFAVACDVLLAPYQASVRTARGGETGTWMSPLKLFIYMAAGKPILASDLPSIREVMVDGANAILLPADEPAAWAAALTRLRADPSLGKRLGGAAKADFLSRHTWHRRAETVVSLLNSRPA